MVAGKKPDFPPLLAPGRHTMTLMEMKALCCDRFPDDTRRANLFQKFEMLFQEILTSGLVCEVWLDGSWLTEKVEPSDIDATIMISAEFAPNSTQYQLIDQMNEGAFGPDLDVFAWQWMPSDHPDYFDEGAHPALTWHEQYGIENSGLWLKGLAVLKVRETNVGIRICS